MQIKTLEGISTSEIANAFNEAFSDYLVPISLSADDLQTKMTAENTKPEFSAGAFSNGKLVGFILIGIDNETAYNGGTGVIPAFRGQNLTRRMYDFLFPVLAENGITNHLLEVITENEKAIPVYEKIGFEKARILICYKGKVLPKNSSSVAIKPIAFEDFSRFWDFKPTYQNATEAITRTANHHQTLGAFADEKLIGYITFIENAGRVKQFAVSTEYRKNGIGRQLFLAAQEIIGDKFISVTNVENSDKSNIFLRKIGLEITVQQHEMTLYL